LVSPRRGKPPAAPDDPASFHLVFTANVPRMLALGWGESESRGARLLGADAFSATSLDNPSPDLHRDNSR
jgi:hypothetical protein